MAKDGQQGMEILKDTAHALPDLIFLDLRMPVYLPDERLHHLVPNGRFTYNPEQRIKIDAAGMSPLQNLQLAVMAAIEFTDQNTESGKLQES